jgi:hypothetical protein
MVRVVVHAVGERLAQQLATQLNSFLIQFTLGHLVLLDAGLQGSRNPVSVIVRRMIP